MDPVQALAIVSLGAFVGVLITTIIYVKAVRPYLAEPEPAPLVSMSDAWMMDDLVEHQRADIEKLYMAMAHHTEQIKAAMSSEALTDLRSVLNSQTGVVHTLSNLLSEQANQLSGLDDRLSRQDQKLDRLESKLDSRLNVLPASVDPALNTMIQAQSDRLAQIGTRLDEWAATRSSSDDSLSEHKRILAELDREIAAQAQTVRLLDTKIAEHTTMLLSAATDRREQAGMLQRILDQVTQVVPSLSKSAKAPPRVGEDRLTDIKGIGPVYASRLYEAGIQSFRQLAALTPEELDNLMNVPAWRKRSIDAQSWIEQAQHFASQREKVEKL